MQDSSAAFDAAVTTRRLWMPPRVRTDWADDGYDGDHTIDDLSPQVASKWTVAHDYDDGYPDAVSFISGSSTPEMETELSGRTVGGVPRTATEYWSPLRTDSPLYGYDRDLAPVTRDVGLITANGPEYVRIFTGQMTNTPVRGGAVQLKALSGTRLKLMAPVLPPAFSGDRTCGLYSCWVVSWVLFTCGIYAGPKIREGSTTLYYSMHGAFRRMLDAGFPYGNNLGGGEGALALEVTPSNGFGEFIEDGLDWIDGPYVAAPDLLLTAAVSRRAYQVAPPLDTSDGQAPAFSQTGNAGRLEMWIKGDAADVNNAPGGSASVSRLAGLQLQVTSGSGPVVQLGVNTSRQVYVSVYDGTNTRVLTSASTLPTDGGWYFVGAAYDMTVDKLWVNLNGTVASSSTSMLTSALPATADAFYSSGTFLLSYLPFSDVTFSTGAQANPDSYPLWRNDASFAPTARVNRTPDKLVALAETTPREAWQIIVEHAQANLAAMRCDELDAFEFLTPGWWVRDAQQVRAPIVIDTARNAGPMDIDYDPTKIRNTVTVSYGEASLPVWSAESGSARAVFQLATNQEIRISPGVTTIVFTLSTPAAAVGTTFQLLDDITAPLSESTIGVESYATFNSALDGTGAYQRTGITITVTSWNAGAVTCRFVNNTASNWYLANNVNVPGFVISGLPVSTTATFVTDSDATSVAQRGSRSLPVSAPALQTSAGARRLARNLKMNLRNPRATIGDESTGINVTGDPRRQPGDLTGIRDTETGVGGDLWRLQSVRHSADGASYTQQVVAREVFPICIVGQGIVGQSLVGPSS